MSDVGSGMPRREFLSRGAKLAVAATAAPFVLADQARGATALKPGPESPLGLIGMDHVGLTVPDINQAIEWFEDVMGAAAPLTFGPFSDPVGTFMQDLLGVDPRAVIDQITMLRIGRSANIELFQYEAPDQRHTVPAQLGLDRPSHRLLCDGHRRGGRVHAVARRAEVPRAAAGHRRSGCGTVDQLLPNAVRHVHRADQLSERDGVRACSVMSTRSGRPRRTVVAPCRRRCRACSASTMSGSPFRTSSMRRDGSRTSSASRTH